MKMNIARFLVALALFVLIFPDRGIADKENGPFAKSSLVAINTAEEAFQRALGFTGFDASKGFERHRPVDDLCNKIIMCDSTTPFISDQFNGKPSWRVKLYNLNIHLKGNTPEGVNLGPCDFDVILDSITGLPLEVVSISNAQLEREATDSEAEIQLSCAGEKYIGLPDQYPVLTVLDVLNQCKFYPALAKKMIVNYVLYTRQDSPPQPAWIIYLRGLPSTISGRVPKEKEYMGTNFRYVFDAMTGELLWNSNLPHPDLDNE